MLDCIERMLLLDHLLHISQTLHIFLKHHTMLPQEAPISVQKNAAEPSLNNDSCISSLHEFFVFSSNTKNALNSPDASSHISKPSNLVKLVPAFLDLSCALMLQFH
jgi:hypothetical protein